MDNILLFLKELKYAYKDNELIYTRGSCFRLFKMLQAIFPSAEPYYSEIDGHWVTRIENKFYDINGEVYSDYIEHNKYILVTSLVELNSAYVPTYQGQSTSYHKYRETI